MKVKLCGFTKEDSLRTAIEQKCDFVGFVFCEKSVRNISIEKAAELAKIVPSSLAKVAVVVDPTTDFLGKIIKEVKPQFIQFHGNESVEFLNNFKKDFPNIGIIKAFRIKEAKDLELSHKYFPIADFFLFDSKAKDVQGGSGHSFEWNILNNFSINKDWFLSGGLNINNIEEAISISKATMIDVSSGIEEIRGQKSSQLIENFMNKVRNYAKN